MRRLPRCCLNDAWQTGHGSRTHNVARGIHYGAVHRSDRAGCPREAPLSHPFPGARGARPRHLHSSGCGLGPAPLTLIVTPLLTAVSGTLIARALPYGLRSVLLDVGCSALAISAGCPPDSVDTRHGVSVLASDRRRASGPHDDAQSPTHSAPRGSPARKAQGVIEEKVEAAPRDPTSSAFFLLSLIFAFVASDLSGSCFVLFRPLVSIGFDAFALPPFVAEPPR